MSVSSHLSPEPERRLLIILDRMIHAGEQVDLKIGALTAFAAVELAWLRVSAAPGPLSFLSMAALGLALPLGVLGFSPLTGKPRWFPIFEPPKGRPGPEDNLMAVEDIVKYAHGDLISRLDRYLGGGITATPYHEDVVGQIVLRARVAARKERLFVTSCLLVGAAQLLILALPLWYP